MAATFGVLVLAGGLLAYVLHRAGWLQAGWFSDSHHPDHPSLFDDQD